VRAAFRLLRFPALMLAVIAASALLALTNAAGPLFVAAAGGDLFDRFTRESPLPLPAVTITSSGYNSYESALYRDRSLREALLPLTAAGVTTVGGEVVSVERGAESDPGRLMARTGAIEEHIEVVAGGPGKGVWLADYTAERIGASVGDRISLVPGLGTAATGVRVTGLYRDLIEDPVTAYWAPIQESVYPAPGANTRPPVPVLADERTFFALSDEMEDDLSEFRWDFDLEPADRTLDQAAALAGALYEINLRLSDPTIQLGAAFTDSTFESPVQAWVQQTRDAVESISGPVGSLSLAGRAVAVASLAGAGIFMVRRRKVEYDIFVARGVSPWRLGARSAFEMLIPAAVGTALGWVFATWLVRALGPQGPLVRPALIDSAFETALVGALGLGLVAIAVAVSIRSASLEGSGRLAGVARRLTWEPVVLALAGASFYEISSRPAAVSTGQEGGVEVDALLLIFPLLFIVGAAGVLFRLVFRWLPRLRSRGRALRPSLYLALRRLTHGSGPARTFITAAAIAIGVFVFAAVMSSSTEATAGQEAALFTGAEVRVNVAQAPSLPDAPFEHTTLARLPAASIDQGGEGRAELLGVDPATFDDVAYWRDQYASDPLPDLLQRLQGDTGDAVPVLVSGEGVAEDRLFLGSASVPFDVVGRAEALPGAVGENAVVIADLETLERAFQREGSNLVSLAGGYEVWASGAEKAAVLERLEREGASVREAVSLEEVRGTPDYLALTWTFDFLEALGVITSGVVLIGCLLFLQARQRRAEAAYAIARRMGLSRGAHRASVGLELVGMLLLSAVVGSVLAVAAAALTHGRLDLGGLGQIPLFLVPPRPLLALALALTLFAALCAFAVQRRADSADVSQVMRYGS
jgi:putative ABC transport system permease protein